jgi:molybdate transport system substrate-binding protein
MKKITVFLLLIVIFLAGFGLGFVVAQNIKAETQKSLFVYWGAATRAPALEIIDAFKNATGVRVEATFGGSGPLLSALELSRSGDLFLGVGTSSEMQMAVKKNLVDASSIRRIAYLVPVVFVQKGNPKNITTLEDLARSDVKLCLTDPTYGVGLFVKEILERNGLWDKIKGRFVEVRSGEEAVANVILGSVDATVSWHVFYYQNKEKVELVWIDPSQIEVSTVPAAITVYTKDKVLSDVFLSFLSSTTSKEILAKYGYITTVEQGVKLTPYSETWWRQQIER